MRGQESEHAALRHQVADQRGGVEKLPIGALHTLHSEILSSLYKSARKTRALFSSLLERLALVPSPGPDWPEVVAALLDGIDLVVVAAPTATAPVPARRLSARARQRGSVLVGVGEWPRAELTIEADHGVWHGLESGRGRLRCRWGAPDFPDS